MAVTAIVSNHYKYQLGKGLIDLTSDTLKILLMRTGFVYDKDTFSTLINIKGTITGASDISFTAATDTISTSTGGFLAAGFVTGNSIAVTGTTSNNVTVVIASVTDTALVVTAASLTDEANTSAVITADDEIATAFGYTQDTKTTGTVAGNENDTGDYADFTFPTVTWTASGGSIIADGAILYDSTSTDNTIIGYLKFGVTKTATDATPFTIAGGTIRIV